MRNLSPSNLARRMQCPGSHRLESQIEITEISESAQEGIVAHWLAAQLLTEIEKPKPFDIEVTEEMRNAVNVYVKLIQDLRIHTPARPIVERKMEIKRIHPNCVGTPNAWLFDQERGDLYIFDFKYGHASVEVFENWQLMEYAAGILNELNIDGVSDAFITVCFYIVQPRGFHRDGPIREWRIKADKLRVYFNLIEQAEYHATSETAECRASHECRNCTAKLICPALQEAGLNIIDTLYNNVPRELDAEQTGSMLRYVQRAHKILDALKTALEEQATALLKRGKRVPHFTLQSGGDRKIWNCAPNEIIELGKLLGFNLSKPVEAVTPKQALDQGVPPEMINGFIAVQNGALKLTQSDTSESRKIFNNGE